MNSKFEPELGQMLFSNGCIGPVEMPEFVEDGLRKLGEIIESRELSDPPGSPADNMAARFENDVFSMRSYCWCGGDAIDHLEGCPPNFKYKDFEANWYKYLGRGSSISRKVSEQEFEHILNECLESLKGSDHA